MPQNNSRKKRARARAASSTSQISIRKVSIPGNKVKNGIGLQLDFASKKKPVRLVEIMIWT